MTPEAQNIAIAESLGWIRSTDPDRTRGRYEWVVLNPDGFEVFWSDRGTYPQALPNYHSSLDACAEFEKFMNNGQWWEWVENLTEVCGGGTALCISSTAPQRCEAYLRTLNLWQESK